MSELIFDGFEPANTTPVPDILFDVLLPYLNEAQLKVMLYIIRRTLGFKKTADAISLKQFRWGITTKDEKKLDGGCGLKNFTTISKALHSLEQMHCIESVKEKTADGDQATTVYRIRFRGTTPTVVPTTPTVVGVLRQTEDGTTPNGGRVLRQTEPQETVIQGVTMASAFAERNGTSSPLSLNAMVALLQANGYQISSEEDPLGEQPIDEIPVPQSPQETHTGTPDSLEAIDGTDLPVSQKTAHNVKASALPKSEQAKSPIASATHTAPSRLGENANGDGPVTPPESGASQNKRLGKPRTPRTATPKPDKPVVTLTQEEQTFYDLYCSMPWIKVAPEITAKVKEHCGNLAPHLKTQEELYALRKFMNSKDFFKGKGFNLPLVVMALNDWAMTQEPIDLEDRRNGVHKLTALGHGSRPQAYGLVSTEELREDPWKVSL